VTVVLPVLWCIRGLSAHRRARRVARGLCATCGYDLRASGERCPECGLVNPHVARTLFPAT
jgi:predicted amidophosphoribosyltransferase